MASQITSLTIVYSAVYSGAEKHHSSASLAFVRVIHRWPVNSPAQRVSNAKNVSIWWRRHEAMVLLCQPFPFLNYYGRIINFSFRKKRQENFYSKFQAFYSPKWFEIIVCVLSAILCRSQCVNPRSFLTNMAVRGKIYVKTHCYEM